MTNSTAASAPARGATTVRTFPYPDTHAVAEFMNAFEQTVRTVATADIDSVEAELRVRLVVEEAIEFANAMGFNIVAPGGAVVDKKSFEAITTGDGIDLVEAADALGDLIVVTKGSAHTLGIDIDSTVVAIHATNLAKMDPVTGKPIRDARGKVTKPEGWVPPTEAIKAILVEDGWVPADRPADRPADHSADRPALAESAESSESATTRDDAIAYAKTDSTRPLRVAAEMRLHRQGD